MTTYGYTEEKLAINNKVISSCKVLIIVFILFVFY